MVRRLLVMLMFLSGVAVLSAVAWRVGYGQGLGQLALRAEADLRLASDRLTGQLQRYRELAVFLSAHPAVTARNADDAGEVFQAFADRAGAAGIYYVDKAGDVQGQGTGRAPRDLGDEAFVRRALQGALGWGHHATPPYQSRTYFHAAPVFSEAGPVQGAVVVAVAVDRIEDDWAGNAPAVFFTDRAGLVFISNRSELVSWRRPDGAPGLVPPRGRPPPFDSYWIGPHEIWELGWGRFLPERALHLTQDLPVIGLRSEVLVSTAPVRRLAWSQAMAVASLCLAFGALLFLATERRRTLARANAQLEARVAERTAALAQAQADLVQAEKLSALGKMSAGISHELNQPLMAIQSYAENAVQFLTRGKAQTTEDNLHHISDLARRMGRIIKNFRAFARQESEPAARVDVVTVLDSAVDLLAARLATTGPGFDYQRPPHPIWVRGGEVRLGQVFVNLISNALDAMAETDHPALIITVTEGARIQVGFQDNGPGIEMPDRVFEPFYSTKAVGAAKGMGLGLSISYGIVQSFGGDIRGRNTQTGACFTVELDRWDGERA